MTLILTHRGLEPSKKNFYSQSSIEAFSNHLERGFGIEFDIYFENDLIFIGHDTKTKKLMFKDLISLIKQSNSKLNALHFKGFYQNEKNIKILIKELDKNPSILEKILIFDVKPEFALLIKSLNPKILLAPSVAHEYDIKRYNSVTFHTLISISDAIKYRKVYDWVLLDEWDRKSNDLKEKSLYNKENFEILRKEGYKIVVISPELHSTSPGLLGGESHQDAKNKERLFKRITEIIKLEPDAICTDYPDECKEIIN